MKILKLSISFVLLSSIIYAQTDYKNKMELVGGLLFNNVIDFPNTYEDDCSYSNSTCMISGLQYTQNLTPKWGINLGASFYQLKSNFTVLTSFGQSSNPKEFAFNIIQCPVRVRYNINRLIYVKSGAIVNFQIKDEDVEGRSNQSGIGFSLSAGIEKAITEKLYVAFEPEYCLSALVPFNREAGRNNFSMKIVSLSLAYILH